MCKVEITGVLTAGSHVLVFLEPELLCTLPPLAPLLVKIKSLLQNLILNLHCTVAELAWYGRTELLHAALLPLLSQDLPCLQVAYPLTLLFACLYIFLVSLDFSF